MWSSRISKIALFVALLLPSGAAQADVFCPATLAGKPLVNVGVYDGPIENHAEHKPRGGGWDLYNPTIIDPALMTYDYRLRCQYEGTLEEVIVPLPHGTRVCEFDSSYPKVSCHP